MRTIERTRRFKRDFKRQSKGKHRSSLDADFLAVITLLTNDQPLDPQPLDPTHRDHALSGNWVDFRDCHIHPDLVLIYRKPDEQTLQLVRIGSHSELGP